MTIKEQIKILDNNIRHKADYDLYRQNAKISALSSGKLDKYEYLTGEDLGYRPDLVQKVKFEYSPLGRAFNKGFDKNEKREGLLKRLNIEDKTDNQLDLIRDKGDEQLQRIAQIKSTNKEAVNFYSATNKKIKELVDRAIKVTVENIEDNKKVFSVKISSDEFDINKYTNLTYFGSKLFTGKISVEEAKDQQQQNLI